MKDGLSLKCAETEDLPGYMVASWKAYASKDLVLSAAYDASRLRSSLEDTQLYGRRARVAPGRPQWCLTINPNGVARTSYETCGVARPSYESCGGRLGPFEAHEGAAVPRYSKD